MNKPSSKSNEDLVRLVKEHTIEADEAYLKAIDKTDITNRLRTAGFQVGPPG